MDAAFDVSMAAIEYAKAFARAVREPEAQADCDAAANSEADKQRRLERAAEWFSPTDTKTFLVWRFQDAPLAFQCLSHHGGDEDWLLWIPPGNDEDPMWSDGGAFGCCDVQEVKLANGARVRIGAHS